MPHSLHWRSKTMRNSKPKKNFDYNFLKPKRKQEVRLCQCIALIDSETASSFEFTCRKTVKGGHKHNAFKIRDVEHMTNHQVFSDIKMKGVKVDAPHPVFQNKSINRFVTRNSMFFGAKMSRTKKYGSRKSEKVPLKK